MNEHQKISKRSKMLEEDNYEIYVKKVSVDTKTESELCEHWSGAKVSEYMGDGGETFQVTGLAARNPDVMEQYEITYPPEVEGVYGTVTSLRYARKNNGNFERLMMGVSQRGFVDVAKENGVLKEGPGGWTTAPLLSSLVNIQLCAAKRGLPRIIPKLSKEAAAFLEYLLKVDYKKL